MSVHVTVMVTGVLGVVAAGVSGTDRTSIGRPVRVAVKVVSTRILSK